MSFTDILLNQDGQINQSMNKNNLSVRDLERLLGFFNNLGDLDYCVVKLSDTFPNIKMGDDIDLIVKDVKKFTNTAFAYFKNKYQYETEITTEKFGKLHFDITSESNLVLRLDITSEKPDTKGLKLKQNYYTTIFSNTHTEKYKIEDLEFTIKIPDIKYEILVRTIEYFNYPQKKWHKKYLLKNINHYKNNIDFYNKYIDLDIDLLLIRNSLLINLNNVRFKAKNKIKKIIYKNQFFAYVFLYRKNYKKEDPKNIDIGWTEITTSSSIELPIDKIFINLNKSGNLIKASIEQSPHFEFVKKYNENNLVSENYRDYLIENYSEFSEIDIENKINTFLKINNSFKKNRVPFELVVSRDLGLYFSPGASLLDGVHRLSVMKYFDVHKIKCYINDIK